MKHEIESYTIHQNGKVTKRIYKSKAEAKRHGIKEAYNVKEMRFIKL